MAAAQQLDKDLERLLCELTCSLSGNEVQFFSAKCETCFQHLSIDEKELFRRLLGKLLKTAQGGFEASQPSACSRTFSEETTRNDNADEQPTNTNAILAPISHSASLENTNDACVDSAVVVDAATDNILAATNFVHVQSIIPTFIRHLLVSCIDTPGYFFTASEPHFSPIRGGVPDAFYRLYQKEGCRDLLEIHRRFELRNLLLLVVDLGYHTGEKWVWGALNDLPAVIKAQSPLLTLTTPEIKKYLDHYVRLGRAYDKWVQMFGDPGYLIALPLMVSETEYTGREYSKCIPAAIDRLRRLGIDKDVEDLRLSELADFISKQLYARSKLRTAVKRKASKRKRKASKANTGNHILSEHTISRRSEIALSGTADTIVPIAQDDDAEAFRPNSNAHNCLPYSPPTEVYIGNSTARNSCCVTANDQATIDGSAIDLVNSPEMGIPPTNGNYSHSTSKVFRKRPRLERSRLLSLPSSQSVNRMPSQLEDADRVSNTFQDNPSLDDNLPRPCEGLTSLSSDTGSQNIHEEALNEFQSEAPRDEISARPFEDLDAEVLNGFFESLNNKNLGCPSKDNFSQPLAKDTGSQNVDEEALSARPFEFTFSQPPSWDTGSQNIHEEALNEFQLEARRDEIPARPFEDLDAEVLNGFFESLNNKNLGCPSKDNFSQPLAKDTGSQNVDEEALSARPFEFTFSQPPPWDMGPHDIDHEALNAFQFEARRDENSARPFEDLDAEVLNGFFESLNNRNLGCPSKDHFSQPLAKDTGPQNVDEEALNARPSELTVSQPPWDMGSQDFDQASSSFQHTSPINNKLAHHSTQQISDDESRYMSDGSNDSHFVTPTNTSHTQLTDHHFSRYTGFDANETRSNLQNVIYAN